MESIMKTSEPAKAGDSRKRNILLPRLQGNRPFEIYRSAARSRGLAIVRCCPAWARFLQQNFHWS